MYKCSMSMSWMVSPGYAGLQNTVKAFSCLHKKMQMIYSNGLGEYRESEDLHRNRNAIR